MIVAETFYGIKCNRCNELFDDGEHSFWNDENSAEENAMESEWIEEKGKHYCTKCYEYNDEKDENVIKLEFPKHLKTLISFINRTTELSNAEVSETKDHFTVTAGSYKGIKLMPFEENYIKNLLGIHLVSIEHKKHDRYTRMDCIINFSK